MGPSADRVQDPLGAQFPLEPLCRGKEQKKNEVEGWEDRRLVAGDDSGHSHCECNSPKRSLLQRTVIEEAVRKLSQRIHTFLPPTNDHCSCCLGYLDEIPFILQKQDGPHDVDNGGEELLERCLWRKDREEWR